jgi:hypothetical protein
VSRIDESDKNYGMNLGKYSSSSFSCQFEVMYCLFTASLEMRTSTIVGGSLYEMEGN